MNSNLHTDTENSLFSLATELVSYTNRHVFLTGNAGTGKTTFLKQIKSSCNKNIVVVAPTGIAAVNAGGVTIHSMFQLGFEPFIPDSLRRMAGNPNKIYKMGKEKIEVIKSMELLIIDEVSMLRADVLDAINDTLQRFRGSGQPFGGVQMLYIGDLYQLPPVVGEQEWGLLREYYETPFFFSSLALQQKPPLHIELKKIYRQTDQQFIELLGRVRNSATTPDDLSLLNKLYKPDFRPSGKDSYIVLSTHNHKADRINRDELERLPSTTHSFNGVIIGEFSENSLPTEKALSLKVGAQVMFIRNDVGDKRRYYNGKLATISSINGEEVYVKLADSDLTLKLEKETWQNIRYVTNPATGKLEEETLGSFTQYPIRLAWAITIHKSQGLTFEKLIVDAEQAFAEGQVYVALSRCTKLDGIILHSPLSSSAIMNHNAVRAFSSNPTPINHIQAVIKAEKPRYCAHKILSTFEFSTLIHTTKKFKENLTGKKIPDMDEALQLADRLVTNAGNEYNTAQKFQQQLLAIFHQLSIDGDINPLKDRIQKAADYFLGSIYRNIIEPLQQHSFSLKNASKVKLYLKKVEQVEKELIGFVRQLQNISYGEVSLVDKKADIPQKETATSTKEANKKAGKGESALLSLELFNAGQPIEEIAKNRNLASGTIESHLTGFVATGELSSDKLISDEKLASILLVLENSKEASLGKLKEIVGSKVSYFELKVAIAHNAWLKAKK